MIRAVSWVNRYRPWSDDDGTDDDDGTANDGTADDGTTDDDGTVVQA